MGRARTTGTPRGRRARRGPIAHGMWFTTASGQASERHGTDALLMAEGWMGIGIGVLVQAVSPDSHQSRGAGDGSAEAPSVPLGLIELAPNRRCDARPALEPFPVGVAFATMPPR